jgi:phospholipase/carboxylesterase
MDYLPHIEMNTTPTPEASVIWLHGLGADGNDFAPIVPELRLPAALGVRFIFPHAPAMPVTINGGYVMPAWYDILDMSIDRKVDIEQLLESAAQITALVDREIERGIASQKIVLAGFSQGGAVALQCALTYPKPLAGLLFMSSYFASQASIKPHPSNKKLAIEIHHGTADPVVPVQLGQQCFSALGAMGYPVEIKTYPMEHAVCPQQIGDISAWLQQVLVG